MALLEQWTSHAVEETLALGERFAGRLHKGDVVALEGELGSGKTHFVKGICRGLGFDGLVSSPTFALIHEYDASPTIYHVDLYRLESAAQVRPLGLEELMRSDSIVLIEWPHVGSAILPSTVYHVRCAEGADENERIFVIDHSE